MIADPTPPTRMELIDTEGGYKINLAPLLADAWDEGWAARSDSLAVHRAATTANPYRKEGATT